MQYLLFNYINKLVTYKKIDKIGWLRLSQHNTLVDHLYKPADQLDLLADYIDILADQLDILI